MISDALNFAAIIGIEIPHLTDGKAQIRKTLISVGAALVEPGLAG